MARDWGAVDSLGDAYTATKRLLLPFSLRRWLVVAVAVFFVSGSSVTPGINLRPFGTTTPPSTDVTVPDGFAPIREAPPPPVETTPFGLEVAVVLAILVAVFVLGVVIAYVSSVMEFVFVKLTARQEVRVRGFFGESLGKGLSLLLFRIAVGFVVAGTVALLIVLVFLTGGTFLIFLVLLSPFFVVFVVVLWLVARFTVDFVVPVMISEDTGILRGWRVFIGELRAEWEQYALYAFVRFVLGIAAGFVVGVGALTLAILLGIPFGIVALLGLFLGEVLAAQTAALVLFVAVAVVFLVTLVVAVVTFVQVPVQTYLRYYSLFVLGAVSPEYDLVDEIREEMEETEEAEGQEDSEEEEDSQKGTDEESR